MLLCFVFLHIQSVCGRICQGQLRVGESVACMPLNDVAIVKKMSIRGIESDTGFEKLRLVGRAGDNVEIYVTGIDIARVSTGFVLCHSKIMDSAGELLK
jgi:translation elongation factor EF-1alpha